MAEIRTNTEYCMYCTTAINVADFEPYSEITCPNCKSKITLKIKFEHFTLLSLIETGGMSRVFRAWDNQLEREVAIKILRRTYSKNQDRILQFEREAKLTASITHPNIVRVYSAGLSHDHFYIAMELIEGTSLEKLINRKQKISTNQLTNIARKCLDGLNAAHSIGLIHRDIKPGNILLINGKNPKIVDFGLALITGAEQSDEIWATPYYVAPETLEQKNEDYRSDIYSLGACLYHLYTGQPSHDIKTHSIPKILEKKRNQSKIRSVSPDIPKQIASLIDNMMAVNPKDRPKSYQHLIKSWSNIDENYITRSIIPATKEEKILSKLQLIIISAISVAIFGIAGYFGYQNNATNIVDTKSTTFKKTAGEQNITQKFLDARNSLLSRNYSTAARDFQGVASSDNIPSITKCWSHINSAIGYFLEGSPARARQEINNLAIESKHSKTLLKNEAYFFLQLDKYLNQNINVTYNRFKSGSEHIALLLCGLQDWSEKKYHKGIKKLNQFNELKGDEESAWIEKYHTLTKHYIHDYNLYSQLTLDSKPTNISHTEKQIETINHVLLNLKTQSGIKQHLSSIKNLLEKNKETAVAQQKVENEKATTEQLAFESEKYSKLLKKLDSYYGKQNQKLAILELDSNVFKTQLYKNKQKDLVKLWKHSRDYLSQLALDINTRGYKQKVIGLDIDGTIISATEKDLLIDLGVGKTRVLLEKIPIESLFQISKEFISKEQNSENYYKRWAQIVCYAWTSNRTDIAGKFAKVLSTENREFRDFWKRITLELK